jgi:hypothetical protein
MSWWSQLFSRSTEQKLNRAESLPSIPLLPTTPFQGSHGVSDDPLYSSAVDFVLASRSTSASELQRALKIGYSRSVALINAMERDALVSPIGATGDRRILSDLERATLLDLPQEVPNRSFGPAEAKKKLNARQAKKSRSRLWSSHR